MEGSIEKIIHIIKQLRGENGCPWDKKQNIETLKPFLIEEAYEAVENIDNKNWQGLAEELGDLLFLLIFIATIAEEEKLFTLSEIIEKVCNKIINRHPHVFKENNKFITPEEIEKQWHKLKQLEKDNIMDGIPTALPALIRAYKITKRAQEVGFDWNSPQEVFSKIKEEIEELEKEIKRNNIKNIEAELGDLLLSIVNLARLLNVNAEEALQKACNRFVERFNYIERKIKEMGKNFAEVSLQEMDLLWNEVKKK